MTARAMLLSDVPAIQEALRDGQELSLAQRVALSAIVREWTAAPDMAEALERLLIEAGEGSAKGRAIDLLPRKTILLARAALQKARGQ